MPETVNNKPLNGKKLPWGEALRSDLPASIIVFLVALPLCIGIAEASGAPPATGLIAGIVGGLVVGLLAGSPLQVSGPAAGLFVLVAQVIDSHGLAAMGVAVLVAGLIQLVAGLLKLGGLFRAVSPAVIQGMLSGIGVLIFAKMFHQMVDDKNAAEESAKLFGKGIANLITIPQSLITGLTPIEGQAHHLAAAIGLGTILILAFWKLIPVKALNVFPAPVVAVVAASLVAYLLGITSPSGAVEGSRVQIAQIEVPSDLSDSIQLPTPETLRGLLDPSLLLIAVTIALVASAETMLCAAAVDKMQTHAKTDYSRELTAQGIGNMACGFLGALPITGVIVRSSANVDAGGRTRLSAILHGAWLLLFVASVPWLLNLIPMASLAAVLVFTGWKLINFPALYKLWQTSKAEWLICVITLATVVGVDLLKGVITGIVLTAARLLYAFSHIKVRVEEEDSAGKTTIHLDGPATFLALPKLTAVLDEIDPSTELHVKLEEVTFVDHACLELFTDWEKQHEAAGGKLIIDWDDLTATFRETLPRAKNSVRSDASPSA